MYVTVPPVPNATVEPSVPVNVKVLFEVNVFPSIIVNVDPFAGAVIVTLLTVVAVATPIVGVINVGLSLNTNSPVPVSSLITPANSLELVAENALNLFDVYVTVPPVPNATFELSVPVNVSVLLAVNVFPLTTVSVPVVVLIVNPLIDVAVATPNVGVISVGLLSNTILPVPVILLTCVPLIFNTLPVPAVSKVLLVNIAVLSAVR